MFIVNVLSRAFGNATTGTPSPPNTKCCYPACENKSFVLRSARCYVEISRSRIASNYRAVCKATGSGVEVMGVVKADAYGHGSVEVSRILIREGARWLAVSSVDEGVTLRSAGVDSRILVMAGVMPWERSAVREYRLTPAVHSVSEIASFHQADAPLDIHLKIDTGLNRLGSLAHADEIAGALKNSPGIRLEGLMSHFASAADFTSPQTEAQIQMFDGMVAALERFGVRPPLTHCASTNAIAYVRPGVAKTLVRPGHAIYGYVSSPRGHAPASALHVSPALSWKTRIVAVKDLPAGARVGYGGTYTTQGPTRAAIL